MKIVFTILLLFCWNARADFGEIDILVQESIENYFSYLGRKVDLQTLDYLGEPELNEGVLKISTTVQAEQGFTYTMDLHECTTLIEVLRPGKYRDLGSDCSYDRE